VTCSMQLSTTINQPETILDMQTITHFGSQLIGAHSKLSIPKLLFLPQLLREFIHTTSINAIRAFSSILTILLHIDEIDLAIPTKSIFDLSRLDAF